MIAPVYCILCNSMLTKHDYGFICLNARCGQSYALNMQFNFASFVLHGLLIQIYFINNKVNIIQNYRTLFSFTFNNIEEIISTINLYLTFM